MLTSEQTTTFITALTTSTEPSVVAALAIRNDSFLCDWLNAPSSTMAWKKQVTVRNLVAAFDITAFVALTMDEKITIQTFLAGAPFDATDSIFIGVVEAIVPELQKASIYTVCLEPAKNIEVILGGTTVEHGGVSGLVRSYVGGMGLSEMSLLLNANHINC